MRPPVVLLAALVLTAVATLGAQPAAAQPAAPGPEVTWDFETGDLRGWRASGAAFENQPTREGRSGAGFGHQGEYWVSSYRRLLRDAPPRGRAPVGDAAQGALESPAFDIPRGRMTFLIAAAGAFATRLELVVIDAGGRETRVLQASGNGSDTMQRVEWDVTPFAGRRGRLRIVDAAADAGGRIAVDDIRFASVTVPNVVGRDEAEARQVLEARRLRVGAAARIESRAAEGRVLAQTPRAGTQVEPGVAVDLEVAEAVRVAAPDLVGLDQPAAVRRLEAVELALGRVRREESRQPEGTVVSQSLPAGRRARIGTAVDLVVATPRTTLAPDLLGHDAADAERLLAAAELRRGRVRRRESQQRAGTVLSQTPAAHTRVAPGTAVDFVVAAPVTVSVPDLAGRDERAARTRLDAAQLRRGRVTSAESREPEGTVISQDPAAGARAAVGSAVDLVLATPVTVRVPDLLGLDEAAVETLLAGRELARGIVERQTSERTAGTVIGQEPTAGTRVELGTSVAFVLAVPPNVDLPDLAGLAEADALDLLAASDLATGALSYRESDTEAGLVLEQWPAPGTSVAVGSAVDLVLAAVETVEVPSLVGLPVDAARQVVATLRLAPGIETRRPSREQPEGTVLEQDPPAATRFAVGSPVDLVVAEPALVAAPDVTGLAADGLAEALAAAELTAGAVEETFSLEAGGTVLAQEPPAGTMVPVGAAVAVRVARDRSLWAGPLGAALLAALLFTRARRSRWRRVRRRRAAAPSFPAPGGPAPPPTPPAPTPPTPAADAPWAGPDGGQGYRTDPSADPGLRLQSGTPTPAAAPTPASGAAGAAAPPPAPAAEAAAAPAPASGAQGVAAPPPAPEAETTAAPDPQAPAPPPVGLHLRATPDAGRQQMAPQPRPTVRAVLRCRVRPDRGAQRIDVGATAENWGRLVTGERPA